MNAVERLFVFNDDGIGLDDDGRIGTACQSEADASKSGGAKGFEHDGESFCKMDSLTLRRSSVWDVAGESEKCFLFCQNKEKPPFRRKAAKGFPVYSSMRHNCPNTMRKQASDGVKRFIASLLCRATAPTTTSGPFFVSEPRMAGDGYRGLGLPTKRPNRDRSE